MTGQACVHVPGTAPWWPAWPDWASEEHQREWAILRLMGEAARPGDELGCCGNYNGEHSISRGDTVVEADPEDDEGW